MARYEACETSAAEERLLRELLAAADPAELPHELRTARRMFCGLAALAEERPGGAYDAPRTEMLAFREERIEMPVSPQTRPLPQPLSQPLPRRRIVRLTAAAALLAAALLLTGRYLRTPYAYIDGRAVYDREEALACTTACLARLEALDRSVELFDSLFPEPEPEFN